MRTRLAAIAILWLTTFNLLCQRSPDQIVQLRQTLEISKRRAQLEMEGGTPFHLKASFQWLNPDGQTWGNGTLDELWQNPHHFRHAFTLEGRELVQVDNGTQIWRTGQWTIPFAHGLDEALKPFMQLPTGDRLNVEGAQHGVANLDCIGTEPEIPGVDPNLPIAETTFCLAKGNHLLHLISRPNGITIAFSDIPNFEKKYIARSLEVARQAVPIFRLQIDSLAAATEFSAIDEPPPPGAQTAPSYPGEMAYQTGELMHGQVIHAANTMLSRFGRGGVVHIRVHIDKTGTVTSADILDSPSPFLSNAARSSVMNWKYRVAYQYGKLVDDEQVINFDFGPAQ
jgi:TonB family protein